MYPTSNISSDPVMWQPVCTVTKFLHSYFLMSYICPEVQAIYYVLFSWIEPKDMWLNINMPVPSMQSHMSSFLFVKIKNWFVLLGFKNILSLIK
jgi:hypothetical protein